MHADGSVDVDPSVESLSALYDELSPSKQEEADVSVTHEASGWFVTALPDGLVVLERYGSRDERHMKNQSKEQVLALWTMLAEGQIDRLLKEPWKKG